MNVLNTPKKLVFSIVFVFGMWFFVFLDPHPRISFGEREGDGSVASGRRPTVMDRNLGLCTDRESNPQPFSEPGGRCNRATRAV